MFITVLFTAVKESTLQVAFYERVPYSLNAEVFDIEQERNDVFVHCFEGSSVLLSALRYFFLAAALNTDSARRSVILSLLASGVTLFVMLCFEIARTLTSFSTTSHLHFFYSCGGKIIKRDTENFYSLFVLLYTPGNRGMQRGINVDE